MLGTFFKATMYPFPSYLAFPLLKKHTFLRPFPFNKP